MLLGLIPQIDDICAEARENQSLQIALSGYNSIRQTIDSLARLGGHLQSAGTQVNVAVQTNVNVSAAQIAERLIEAFDNEPEIKARIAQVLLGDENECEA